MKLFLRYNSLPARLLTKVEYKIIMKTYLMIFILTSLFNVSLMAREHLLTTITEDISDNLIHFIVVTDEENIKISNLLKVVYDKNENILSREVLDIDTKGLVLKRHKHNDKSKKDPLKIIILKSIDMDVHEGGHGYLEYLKNAILKSTDIFIIKIERFEDTWVLKNEDDEIISHLHFKCNKVFPIGVVGVDHIIDS